ncbi:MULTISPECIES: AMP-binding protein [unclassified Shinella]|uniref:class I adenylate-forming enzyme family protein n=1 Tax=unclassified Shinella TaxID=2643062 RepID=UPI00225C5E3A|nr:MULTISPECIES: AMP-binding protein [unclassified Shinella]MCO5137604.1 AMP-binding protein [Shinella sp.]MDC7257722.1 AMP-binding protein [Shinella sp. YE25]CAI0335536.1 Fatty-acyl-CoA synthase [Rhizobiaceae bacterium]CAK7259841.1 Fatty-acyl-CoA synthase [Shinella sp. WSC3-e]
MISDHAAPFDIDALCATTISAALARAATLAGDVEAVVAADGRLTYAALAAEVARIRDGLAAQGVRKGEHIGLCLGNSTRWVAIFLAIGSLGAVTVPINTRFVAAEMAYALSQSKVSRLILCDRFLKIDFIGLLRQIDPALTDRLPAPALPDLRQLIVIGDNVPPAALAWEALLASGASPAQAQGEANDPLLIQYTSGTTSFPKGVLLTQRSMLGNAFVSGHRMGLRVGDRFHSARPFFHVAGTTLSILSCLQHMATLVSMDRFEPGEALRLMEAERCTHFSGNDTMALMLLSHPERQARRLVLRGAWLAASPTIVARVIDELGAGECVIGYGLSEAAPNVAQSSWWEPEAVRISAAMRPQPGIDVRILKEDGEDAACGESGEILVRGWSVMREYFDKPAETRAALSADGWLSTGDLGALDENGRLTFLGRAKEIVRVGGENVSPADVENVLHRHAAIRQAAVVGVPDERLVEVTGAFVILKEGAKAEPAEIMDWAKANMAGFKVPRHVWIVESFEAIGMTASSKIQKKQLAEHARKLIGA